MTIEQMREYLSKYKPPVDVGDDFVIGDWFGYNYDDCYYGGWDHAERAMAAHLITLIDGPTQP